MLRHDVRKLKALVKGNAAIAEHIKRAERDAAFAEEVVKALEEVEEERSRKRAAR
jgi:hypothetical protein